MGPIMGAQEVAADGTVVEFAAEPAQEMISLEKFSKRALQQPQVSHSKLTEQAFVAAVRGISSLYLGETARRKTFEIKVNVTPRLASEEIPEKKILLAIEENADVPRSVSKRMLAAIGETVLEFTKPNAAVQIGYLGTIERRGEQQPICTLHFKRAAVR